jgi:hypothetical protein
VIAVGKDPLHQFRSFAEVLHVPPPEDSAADLEPGEALVWFRDTHGPPYRFRTIRAQQDRRRHLKQYAEGELSPEQSFYFRGPENKLNLRAQNLMTFLQLADGVDDDTWNHHLKQGDYSRWFRQLLKDDDLARQTALVETNADLPAKQSRERIKGLVQERYTAAA